MWVENPRASSFDMIGCIVPWLTAIDRMSNVGAPRTARAAVGNTANSLLKNMRAAAKWKLATLRLGPPGIRKVWTVRPLGNTHSYR